MKRIIAVLVVSMAAALSPVARADEGMWLPNALPIEAIKARYGWEPSAAWIAQAQQASVRLPGCSGSFVSSEGLVMTNHHCAIGCAAQNSTKDDDIVANGFVARYRSDERVCQGMDLHSLQAITDITSSLKEAVPANSGVVEAEKARRAALTSIEQAESRRTGQSCQTVPLYNGGQYHLYCYKRYTDVRLVFVPEVDVARFGGDPDNFEFPRFDLDAAFLRAYENGKPARPHAHFRWAAQPVVEGEPVFVTGHPGRTERLMTVAEAKFLRDTAFPFLLNFIRQFEGALLQYGFKGAEQARIVDDELFSFQNARKARVGMLDKLQDPAFMDAKELQERSLQMRLAQRRPSLPQLGTPWTDVQTSMEQTAAIYPRLRMLERGNGFSSQYFDIARTIVRLATERVKLNGERLREYAEGAIPSIEQSLSSESTIHDDLEVATLGESLVLLVATLGGDDETVRAVLAGKGPRERAFQLVSQTRLKDAAYRKWLVSGGITAVMASEDPMIRLALAVDSESRRLRQVADEAAELKQQGYAKIVEAKQALDGTTGYPDATFTLRIATGTVKGYTENGKAVPFTTTYAGLYARAREHENLRPWKLPERWLDRKSALDLTAPLNFVSTNDITGGNSGSPLINRKGEVVGLIFDSNIQALGNEYQYSEVQGRAVSVSAHGIREALLMVYDAYALAAELGK